MNTQDIVDKLVEVQQYWERRYVEVSVPKALDLAVQIVKRVDEMVRTKADDVCWRDCYVDLSRLLGFEFVPQLIWDKQCFLANCEAYIGSLMDGKYEPIFVVPSDLVVKAQKLLLECKQGRYLNVDEVDAWLRAYDGVKG